MSKLIPLSLLPTLIGLLASTSLSGADAANTNQTAQRYSIETKRVLAGDYLLFLPADYQEKSTNRWPLILFLHGAGERGTNIWIASKNGIPKVAPSMTNFPFIVVSPQCLVGGMWSEDELLALLGQIEKQYPVDPRRIYLTGLSMGGFGTWNLGLGHPERFAAIAPVCGGGETIRITLAQIFGKATLAQMKGLGVWAFHGARDTTVAPEESQRMVDTLKKAGCTDVKLTLYPEAGHDCWTPTYANPELYEWFLKHSR